MSDTAEYRNWTRQLKRAAKRYNDAEWAIADLMAEGQSKFGNKASKHIKHVTLIPPQTIKRLIHTATRFPAALRNAAWKVITHTRLLDISSPSLQTDIYQKAIDQNWSDHQVDENIKKHKLIKNRAKVQKGVDSLESVLKFSRKLQRIQKKWGKLPHAQKQIIRQEAGKISSRFTYLK